MTFAEWAKDFQIRFNWFGEMLADEDAKILRQEFEETFRKFSVDVLRKATTELTLMDPQPKTGEIMAKLYARCKSLTMLPVTHSKPVDPNAEPRYKCLACVDSGALQVYHPKGYQPIKNGSFEIGKHLNTIMVACTCDAGRREQKERRYMVSGAERITQGLKEYNSDKMRIVNAIGVENQAAELTEFVLSMKPKFSGFENYQ
jgi:hypothetical protein